MDVAENWKAILEIEYAKDKFSCEIFYGTNHDDSYKVLEGTIYCHVPTLLPKRGCDYVAINLGNLSPIT